MVRPRSEGGDDLDGLWNDDFHHSAVVALTNPRQSLFCRLLGTPQEFIPLRNTVFFIRASARSWRKRCVEHRLSASLQRFSFVSSKITIKSQNTGRGKRLRFQTSHARYRAMTAVLLLGPWTPMLFQERSSAHAARHVLADIGDAPVREAIRRGRAGWLAPFFVSYRRRSIAKSAGARRSKVFARCKLDFSERETNHELYRLHIDLLKCDGKIRGFASRVLANRWCSIRPREFCSQIFSTKTTIACYC